MNTILALAKQLFGAKYERMEKSLLTGGILFCSLYVAEIRIAIAPFILYLTAAMVSAGMMWQALRSGKNAYILMGFLVLPIDSKALICSISLAFSGYTLITKTFPVLMVFYAVQTWRAMQIAVSILCACTGCMVSLVCYSFTRRKKQIDAYVFYLPATANSAHEHPGKNGNVFVYLLRYLRANTNYLLNTLGLCGVACFLPLLLDEFEGLYTLPMGFAILCLNTPLCILLSCDPDLDRSLRMLPGQFRLFFIPYCLFIFCFNTLIENIYLLCWQMKNGGIGGPEVLTMLLFAGQGAIFSVLLEWRYPIRSWNVEADLWRHPRKYLVPALMMLIAGVIAIWPASVWLWLCSMILQCLALLIKLKVL